MTEFVLTRVGGSIRNAAMRTGPSEVTNQQRAQIGVGVDLRR
jgi:hypothetical protein